MSHTTITTLANGVRVVSQTHANARSVALGVWLINGARHQLAGQSGFAHFLEHVWFKGTPQHDAASLAREFERMGGQVNAYTGRELTSLQGVVPAAHVAPLLQLFADMLLRPRFNDDDVSMERAVVEQEMAMVEDSPEDAAADAAIEAVWAPAAIGWPILGDKKALDTLNAQMLRGYLQTISVGSRIVVSAAGAVDHQALCEACSAFSSAPVGALPGVNPPPFGVGEQRVQQDSHQTQWLYLMPAPSPTQLHLPSYVIANHILGGGWSSRLFQEIREQRGLAYAVSSRLELYSDTGLWAIQLGCDPDRAVECRTAVERILQQLAHDGPTADELALSVEHIESALLLEQDDLDASMERLAREVIYLGRCLGVDERITRLRGVALNDVKTAFQSYTQRFVLTWGP